ncbi:MAG: trypsin-like peptidase domain-containing protein [Actinophytocola sp.]|uniref:trypsin-like peptidase domain-containing protein n=1 Tax=Actinophytocola sp. TaxID=1872138 RepID=UPI003C74971A
MTGFLGRVLGAEGGPVGTCFQVAPGVLVTAAHVLEDLGAEDPGAAVRVDPLAGGDPFDAHVIAMHSRYDLAVLRGSRELATTIPRLAATGTVPIGAEVTLTAAGHLDDANYTYRIVTATGVWKGAAVRDGTELGRFTSHDVLPGMSGAPVCLASDGSVVGVQSGRYNSRDGWFAHSVWVGRTEVLAELLRRVAPVSLLDVSPPSVLWRERRATYLAAVTRSARERRDSFLVGNCGPPLVPAFVRKQDDGTSKTTPTALPAADLLSMTGDCLLLGGPGAGKSRLLWSWALELTGSATRLPVLVQAGDLATAVGSPLGPVPALDSLVAAVGAALTATGREGLPWLAEWFNAPQAGEVEWIVLVDGLDEVPDERLRNRVRAALTALSADPAWRGRVIVASRPPQAADGAVWQAARYELVPFGASERARFVHGWFPELGFADPGHAARDFLAELDQRGLHDLAGIPLMLVVLAQLFTFGHGQTLPESRVEAYEQIVDKAHRQRVRGGETDEILAWHDEHLPAAVEALHERLGGVDGLLSLLAFARFRGHADSAVDWIADQTRDLRRTTRLSPDHWRVVVQEALRRNSLLVAQGGDFYFVHATLHEFFSARHLARDTRLSRELLWLVASDVTRACDNTFMEWVFAFWSAWPPFTTTLLRLPKKRDPLSAYTFLAELVRRWVRIDPSVTEAAKTHLRTMLAAGSPPDDPLTIPYLSAALRDQRGFDALVAIAGDPAYGVASVNAAARMVALRKPGAADLLADATDAFVTAPEPVRFTDDDARTRREAAQNLARHEHPRAPGILRRLLEDPRADDGRTRRYVCGLLGDRPSPHLADVMTYLFTAVATSDEHEARTRGDCVKVLLRMTDPGSADRFARLAAADTMPGKQRAKAAIRLADLGDPRAGDLLAALTDEPDDETLQDVAWALVRIGDHRAIPPLVAISERTPVIWLWWRQVKAATTNGDPRTANVLLAAAEAPGMSRSHGSEILRWLTLVGDQPGTEAAAAEPGMGWHLFKLADALARRHDRRYATLLARWADELVDEGPTWDDDRRWAARVLAAPDRLLGDGLLADYVTARDIDPHRRMHELNDLRYTDHPRAVDCLLAVHREFEARADLEGHHSPRRHVVHLLAEAGNLAVVPVLAEYVRNPDRYRSGWRPPLELLVGLDGQEVADTLVELAPHVESKDQWRLAHKLSEMEDPRVCAVLAEWVIAAAGHWRFFDGVDWRFRRLREINDRHLVTVHERLMDYVLTGRSDVTPGWAIADVAGVGGPHAADVLAQWAADPRFRRTDRNEAIRALATVDPARAAELGHDTTTNAAPERPRPTSQLAVVFQHYKRNRDHAPHRPRARPRSTIG